MEEPMMWRVHRDGHYVLFDPREEIARAIEQARQQRTAAAQLCRALAQYIDEARRQRQLAILQQRRLRALKHVH